MVINEIKYVYYAETNNQLINIVNLKLNEFYAVPGDLIVPINHDRISKKLLQQIKINKIFENIFELEYGKNVNDVPLISLPIIGKIYWLILDLLSYRRLAKNLKNLICNNKYLVFVNCGFWGGADICTLFFKNNKDIIFYIVEEGMVNYTVNLDGYVQGGHVSQINRFYWFLKYGSDKIHDLNKLLPLIKRIYLYHPSACQFQDQLPIHPLKKITENNPVKIIMEKLYEKNIESYVDYLNKSIFVFLQGWLSYDSDFSQTCKEIDTLIQEFGAEEILLKAHPNSGAFISLHKEFPIEKYDKIITYDKRNFFFEGILPHINVNDKIFITFNSSAVIYPKFMFDMEPIIIFTYNMNDKVDYIKKQSLNVISNTLKSIYSSPNRIYVPESFEEYQSILKNVKNKM